MDAFVLIVTFLGGVGVGSCPSCRGEGICWGWQFSLFMLVVGSQEGGGVLCIMYFQLRSLVFEVGGGEQIYP